MPGDARDRHLAVVGNRRELFEQLGVGQRRQASPAASIARRSIFSNRSHICRPLPRSESVWPTSPFRVKEEYRPRASRSISAGVSGDERLGVMGLGLGQGLLDDFQRLVGRSDRGERPRSGYCPDRASRRQCARRRSRPFVVAENRRVQRPGELLPLRPGRPAGCGAVGRTSSTGNCPSPPTSAACPTCCRASAPEYGEKSGEIRLDPAALHSGGDFVGQQGDDPRGQWITHRRRLGGQPLDGFGGLLGQIPPSSGPAGPATRGRAIGPIPCRLPIAAISRANTGVKRNRNRRWAARTTGHSASPVVQPHAHVRWVEVAGASLGRRTPPSSRVIVGRTTTTATRDKAAPVERSRGARGGARWAMGSDRPRQRKPPPPASALHSPVLE